LWGICTARSAHALADGNQRIQIKEKMLEFSSGVLSTLSSFLSEQVEEKTDGNWLPESAEKQP